MISDEIVQVVNQWLLQKEDNSSSIMDTSAVSGGCINECYKLNTREESYFVKYNFAHSFPDMFVAEAKGLSLLKSAQTIHVPEVIYQNEAGKYEFLLLEYIAEGNKTRDFWENFGRNLARLHCTSHEFFGLDHDNYIGSLPQLNKQGLTWEEFLVLNRLDPLVRKAFDQKLLSREDIKGFERIYPKIENLLPKEKPSLLHGDLWSGNFIVNSQGEACLIDPAVYYGHREMDMAMTKLFGGFPVDFYNFYNEENPLEKGWEKRVEFNQIYPLLVHLLLFGSSYAQQIRYILRKY